MKAQPPPKVINKTAMMMAMDATKNILVLLRIISINSRKSCSGMGNLLVLAEEMVLDVVWFYYRPFWRVVNHEALSFDFLAELVGFCPVFVFARFLTLVS